MPVIEQLELNDDAVLWELDHLDGYSQPVLKDPVPIKCRWRTGSRSSNPQTGVEDVRVVVDQMVPLQSTLWRGKIEDLPSTEEQSAFAKTEIFQVMDCKVTPDIRCVEERYRLTLQRQKATIPVT